jgi:hypothetical protein
VLEVEHHRADRIRITESAAALPSQLMEEVR